MKSIPLPMEELHKRTYLQSADLLADIGDFLCRKSALITCQNITFGYLRSIVSKTIKGNE